MNHTSVQEPFSTFVKKGIIAGLKFLFVGCFIGLFLFLFVMLTFKVLDEEFISKDIFEYVLSLFKLYPYALVVGGVPAFLSGFFIKAFFDSYSKLIIFAHATWLAGLFGYFWVGMLLDFDLIGVLIMGVSPSIVASLLCTYFFIYKKQ